MADENYTIPEDPVYDPNIRKIQNDDPVNAEEVLNPILRKMLENIAAVRAAMEKAIAALVPNTRTINGKVLSENVTLNADDVGALPSSYTPNYSYFVAIHFQESLIGQQFEVRGVVNGLTESHTGRVPYLQNVTVCLRSLTAEYTLTCGAYTETFIARTSSGARYGVVTQIDMTFINCSLKIVISNMDGSDYIDKMTLNGLDVRPYQIGDSYHIADAVCKPQNKLYIQTSRWRRYSGEFDVSPDETTKTVTIELS